MFLKKKLLIYSKVISRTYIQKHRIIKENKMHNIISSFQEISIIHPISAQN